MIFVQCLAQVDHQFKGDFAEPGSERNRLFLKRTFYPLFCVLNVIRDVVVRSSD